MLYDLHTRFDLWWQHHKAEVATIAMVCAACAGFGLLYLDPPQKVGYVTGTVTYFGVREGSMQSGVRLWVETGDGRRVVVDSQSYNPSLKEGASVCLLKTRGAIKGRVRHRLALPRRCSDG